MNNPDTMTYHFLQDKLTEVLGELGKEQEKTVALRAALADLVNRSWAIHSLNTTPTEKKRAYEALEAADKVLEETKDDQ